MRQVEGVFPRDEHNTELIRNTHPPDWVDSLLTRCDSDGLEFVGVLTLLRLGSLMERMNIDLDAIKALPVKELAEENAHLYLWTTNNYLPDALWLVEELGFRYITNIVWVKMVPEEIWDHKRWVKLMHAALNYGVSRAVMRWALKAAGLGQYFNGQHEVLVFAVRGKGMDPNTRKSKVSLWGRKYTGTVMFAPTGDHSEKPEESYELIEARSHGPYLEMFARGKARKGWTVWGDEATQ